MPNRSFSVRSSSRTQGVQLLAIAGGMMAAQRIATRIPDPVERLLALAVVGVLGYAIANELGGQAAADAFIRGLTQ